MPPVEFEPTISANERSQAAHLLRSWVRIPPGAWIFVCCECRVLSGRGLCDELITRPEESYRLFCVVVCDLETSRIGAPYIYNISCLRVKYVSRRVVCYALKSVGFKMGGGVYNRSTNVSSASDRESRLMPQITRKGTFVDGRHLFRADGKGTNILEKEKWSAARPVKQHRHGVGNVCPTTYLPAL